MKAHTSKLHYQEGGENDLSAWLIYARRTREKERNMLITDASHKTSQKLDLFFARGKIKLLFQNEGKKDGEWVREKDKSDFTHSLTGQEIKPIFLSGEFRRKIEQIFLLSFFESRQESFRFAFQEKRRKNAIEMMMMMWCNKISILMLLLSLYSAAFSFFPNIFLPPHFVTVKIYFNRNWFYHMY